MSSQEERLAAIGAAAASVLRRTAYHAARAAEIAAAVRLPGDAAARRAAGRSAVWLHGEIRNRRVLVALAAAHAWLAFRERSAWVPPEAGTVGEARAAVGMALREVIAFHRAEPYLMAQVSAGIGDIAAWEKRARVMSGPAGAEASPAWPSGVWGAAAAEASDGRLGVFADFLDPTLRAAAETVTWLPPETTRRMARNLSNLTFHASLADPDGPPEALAHGLAAFWMEHDLIPLAGDWVRDLEAAELSLAATERRGTDRRAEAAARAVLVRVLLEAGTLHRRGMAEGSRVVGALDRLCERADGPVSTGDLEALCDATSRLGLSAMRWGDYGEADRAIRRSATIAEERLGGDASRRARAESNLAELALGRAQPDTSLLLAGKVLTARRPLLEAAQDQAERSAAWRRLTLSEHGRVVATALAGRVIEAVQLAEALLSDRRSWLGDEDHPAVVLALRTLGEMLLEAGQPEEASRHLERACRARAGQPPSTGYRQQEDLLLLARVSLALGRPADARARLADMPAMNDWFTTTVSFRLGFEVRRWYAVALGHADPAAAAARLEAARAALTTDYGLPAADPVVLSLDRDRGSMLLQAGDAAAAAIVLGETRERERAIEAGPPARAATLIHLARCGRELGDAALARACRDEVRALARHGVSPTHPLVLTATVDEAATLAEDGRPAEAVDLLRPVLDRSPLAHGRPALGDGHPLLAAAYAVRARCAPPQLAGAAHWDEPF